MNVPWSWIKQRPHFIAQELSSFFDVDVYYKKAYAKNKMVKNKQSNVNLIELFRLPFERFHLINILSTYITSLQLKNKIDDYDTIWISDIKLFLHLKDIFNSSHKLIYDCMDDILEFPSIKKNKKQLNSYKKIENELINKAEIVFISSEYLKSKLIKRYSLNDVQKLYVVNNGIKSFDLIEVPKISPDNYFTNSNRKKITYIGTISEWFDFDLILESLINFDNIEYYLFGPKEVEIPKHNRLHYKGVIEHEQVFSVMYQSDLLIMPFIVNELILSVNPVKLYEFIYSLTPTLAVSYGETEKFEDYIYLYKNKKEYMDYVELILKNNYFMKKNKSEVIEFIKENTWGKRAEEIIKIIGDYNK
jgi:hypothetical protein